MERDEGKRTVVRRPEPPSEDRPGLTADEARALLAVTTRRRGPWDKVKPRLRIAFVATTVLGAIATLTLDDSLLANVAVLVAGGLWVVWPLVFAGHDEWT